VGFFLSPFIGVAMTTQLDHKEILPYSIFKLADAPNCSYY